LEKCGKLPTALTVAGVDSSGGAGVTADLKTFNTLGVYGSCVITALTAQNTLEIKAIQAVPPSFVKEQLQTLLTDFEIKAAKTGMLHSGGTVKVVANTVKGRDMKIVVDPVFASASGNSLTTEDAVTAYTQSLLPVANLVTPNVPEAQKLSGIEVHSLDDMKEAARRIHSSGVQGVVIKGGHLKGGIVKDLLFYDGNFTVYRKPRVKVRSHGGGCVFSAAITGYLAKGLSIRKAVEGAEQLIQEAISFSLKVGRGREPVNPMVRLYNMAAECRVEDDVALALKIVKADARFLPYIAEVGTQIAMALLYPTSPAHVAAIENRIRRRSAKYLTAGSVKFGVSSHMARLILSCQHLNPEVRAAMNLHCNPALAQAFKAAGLTVGSFDRRNEPEAVKRTEGASMGWGVKEAAKNAGVLPDVIYDLGEADKEPMIRVVGRSASEVVRKAIEALNYL